MTSLMSKIEHVVVAMMENRSFDNLLGWLYAAQDNQPPHVLPSDSTPFFDGLSANRYSNKFNDQTIYASLPTSAWPPNNNPFLVPDPDPGEDFNDMTTQIFGTPNPLPFINRANMSGFLKDYTGIAGVQSAGQIMQSYSPEQVPVLSQLARSFAVSDRWFASVPCQTWPNRGFVHTGSSDGHINNDTYEPYDIETIFNVMEKQGISWGVYSNTYYTPSLTHIQFPKLWGYETHFHYFSTFEDACKSTNPSSQLPGYSFVEPRFQPEPALLKGQIAYPEDYHPPHNVCRGEQFLARLYAAVRNSPYRDKILLIITFDEHGGCYDHVPPPGGSTAPLPGPVSRDGRFRFNRFGVRIPTIVVSSYIQPGTVFRSPTGVPLDHTSILATLRDWKNMDKNLNAPFLPSPRIQHAPTLDFLLTQSEQNKITNWPDIQATCNPDSSDESLNMPANDLHLSLIAGEASRRAGVKHLGAEAVAELRGKIKTYQDIVDYLEQPPIPLNKRA